MENYDCFLKKIMLIVIMLSFYSIILIDIAVAQQPGTETLISINTPGIAQYNPSISNTAIVWADGVNGYLYLYDVVTGSETIIRSNQKVFDTPSISGNYVVSQALESNYDISLYDISTGEETLLDSPDSSDIAPTISGQYVAWKSIRCIDELCESASCDVYLLNISNISEQPQMIAENTGSCGCYLGDLNCMDPLLYSPSPSISGNYVVWDAMVDGQYDIFLFDIGNQTTVNITSDSFDQEYPDISGNYVVWQDYQNGDWDIFYADISNLADITISPVITAESSQFYPSIDGNLVVWRDGGTESVGVYNILTSSVDQIKPDSRNPDRPAISGQRIVYEGISTEDEISPQIYLFSYDTYVDCPLANFTNTSPSNTATAPLTVHFADTSDPTANVSIWNFGDGTPILRVENQQYTSQHTYVNIGTYDVSLTVSTPYCRNITIKDNFISVGQKPVVLFMGTPTCGLVPMGVSFNDLSSGNPTEWAWDLDNDGVTDDNVKNPFYLYTVGGNYSVNLTAVNVIGDSYLLKPGYISVMNRSGMVVNATLDGLSVIPGGGAIILNKSKLPDYMLNGITLTLIPPPENGIEEITLISDVMGFVNSTDAIEGNITKVLIKSKQIPLEGFSEAIGSGAAYFNFTIEFSRYPIGGTITPYSYESYVPCDREYLQKIVSTTGFTELSRTAYEIQLVNSNLGPVNNMTLYFAVNSSWVTDQNKVWVVRIGDDLIGQVLPTHYLTTDVANNIDIFTSYSPRGPSKFALTLLSRAGNPLQLVVLTAQQWFGGDGGGDSDGGVPIVTATTKRVPSPSTVIPETVPAPEPTSTPETLEQATIEAPIPTPTLPMIESPPSPVPTTTTPLPPSIPIIALVATTGVLWLVKRRK